MPLPDSDCGIKRTTSCSPRRPGGQRGETALRHLLQFTRASRVIAGAAGFLTFIQHPAGRHGTASRDASTRCPHSRARRRARRRSPPRRCSARLKAMPCDRARRGQISIGSWRPLPRCGQSTSPTACRSESDGNTGDLACCTTSVGAAGKMH